MGQMDEKPVEVKQVNEREVWVDESKFYLDEDNILYETIVGNFDEKRALEAKNVAFKLMNTTDEKVKVLVDLNNAGTQSSKARKIGREMFELEKHGKIALIGMNPVAKVIASFVMGVTNKKDMRFFKTKDEALEWLKE
jgi:hypothetical protein